MSCTGFRFALYNVYFTLIHFKSQGQDQEHFSIANILIRVTDRKTLLLLSNMESRTGFRLIYLHLILTRSEGQGLDHAYFDSGALGYGEIYDNHCYCNQI